MRNFDAINYNKNNWDVVAEDGTVIFSGDYVACRKKAFELFQEGVTIKHLDLNDGFDYVSFETVQSELAAIEEAKREQREQVEEVELTPSEEKYYNRLIKSVNVGTSRAFNEWHEITDIEPETFLKKAKWLFADPGEGRMCLRALGIEPDGTFVKLKIVRWEGGTCFYEDKKLGRLWHGPHFTWLSILSD